MASKRKHAVSNAKTRVAVYARFSCDKQRDESIEDQLYEAERYCEARGYEIVRAYTDYALSGRSDDRPQFIQMMEDAKDGEFDVVLVWKMDRFARNMQDQFFHEKILNDHGIRLESIKENISGNGIEASMSKGMHAIFAQIRSQQSAEDTMRGMLGKARKCQYLGYQWFGYSHDGDEITLDAANAPIAREIHTRYLSGEAIKDIAAMLNELGVHGRDGKPVGYTFVTGILKNWVYAGVYTWGKAKDEQGNVMLDAYGKPIPLVRVENGVPAIVTLEQKEACLRRLRYRKHVNAKVNYLLSGKLYCPECGQLMHGELCRDGRGVTRHRYCCHGRRKACNGVYWKDATETAIAQSIRSMLSDRKVLDHIAERFTKWRSNKKPSASIEAARADLRNIARRRANLTKAVEEGMPFEDVRERLSQLDAERAGVERKIEELNHAEREISKSDVLDFLLMIADGAYTDAELIEHFVSQVAAYNDDAVAIINFFGKDSTPYEIDCAYKNARNSRSGAVSCNSSLVPPVGL